MLSPLPSYSHFFFFFFPTAISKHSNQKDHKSDNITPQLKPSSDSPSHSAKAHLSDFSSYTSPLPQSTPTIVISAFSQFTKNSPTWEIFLLFYLNILPSNVHKAYYLTSFISLFICHLVKETFLTTPIWHSKPQAYSLERRENFNKQ